MRWEVLLSTLLLIGAASSAAEADFVAAPRFTFEETATIARTDALRHIAEGDPWLVRQILDLAAHGQAEATKAARPSPFAATSDRLSPTSRDAQGIVDWNELIRKAKKQKTQLTSVDGASQPRTALGILDANDVFRNAKAKKKLTSATP